jgi:hypothetical protein
VYQQTLSVPAKIAAVARERSMALVFLGLALLFVLSRGYIIVGLQPHRTDIVDYFYKAISAADLRQVPYKDFLLEYPPVAWWTIYLPRLLDGQGVTDKNDSRQVEPAYKTYRRVFRGLMFLCDVGALMLLLMIVRSRRPDWMVWVALTYTVTTALLGYILYDRLDVGLLFLLMLWAKCWTRSLENPRGKGGISDGTVAWSAAAYAALGLSIGYKLIPVLCVPFLLVSEWHTPRRWARLLMAVLALGATAVFPFAVQYAISGPDVLALFKYHGERGIQIESLFATLMMVGSTLGTSTATIVTHGAFELTGPLAPPMKTASTVALIAFLAVMGLWALVRRSHFTREAAYRMACFVIPASAILSNVLSPQYFVWALPLLLLVGSEILPEGNLRRWVLAILLIVVAGLTTWVFPYHYFSSPDNTLGLVRWLDFAPGPVASAVVGARNLIYLGVIIWLGAASIRFEPHERTCN